MDAPPAAHAIAFRRGIAAVIACTTALLAAIAWRAHRIGDVFAETDFYGAYAAGARAIAAGDFDPARYRVVGPVFDLALALTNVLTGDLFRAGEVISVTAAAATLLFWGGIAGRLAGAAAGFWTVAFLAANAFFLRYGYSVTTELALALQAAAIFFLVASPGRRAPLAAGLFAGHAFLTRYSAIVLVPAALVHYATRLRGRRLADPQGGAPAGARGPRRARDLGLFAAGFALLVGPWVGFSFLSGNALGGQLHHNIAYEMFARARGLTWDQYAATLGAPPRPGN